METVIRNVGDIDANDRHALEHVLGQRLRDNQQLVIRVVNRQVEPSRPSNVTPHDEAAGHEKAAGSLLPEWCNVYAGRATELWVTGRQSGFAPKDADLIIASTALMRGRTLVTGNTTHVVWIPGLKLDNWRVP